MNADGLGAPHQGLPCVLFTKAETKTGSLVAPPIRAFPAFSSKQRNSSGRESGQPKVSERQAGECSSGTRKATRTSLREPQRKPEMRRQIVAQRRPVTPF
ncbi:hypothetical protein [uncultured Slackia sp.]|uniref:hypothetical protein n=1 Tax=uncultured Slackia sp. TaxID=665903 RepID=UPI0025F6C83B|nr:hypothetical protein [uncultured Slackia sp.]